MDKIIVIDNFLKQDELNQATEIIKTNNWYWGHESNKSFTYETPFWSMPLTHIDFFSIHIKEIIEKYFGKKFRLLRVYANGQTFGQDSTFHQDSTEENHYTFCLYLCNIDEKFVDTAGGYIQFKLPELNYKVCFEPTLNRGIFFPSNYFHKATAFNRYIMELRVCIAWKLEEIVET